MSRFTKKVDKSHLTDHEKTHTMALGFLGILLLISGLGIGLWLKVLNFPTVIVSLFFMAGIWCIAFAWGYIGAVEDERSGT